MHLVWGLMACTRPEAVEAGPPAPPPEAQVLFDAVDHSVHELVTCGGAQRSLATTLALRVVLSTGMWDEDVAGISLEELAEILGYSLDVPFERDGTTWHMPMGGGVSGTFDLEFGAPLTGAPIDGDPFVLDSYVTGSTITMARTWQQMFDHPDAVNTFTFDWEAAGPLGWLLAPPDDPEAIPDPIVVETSLMDLALLGFGMEPDDRQDLGAFDRLGDITTTGVVPFTDGEGEPVRVAYDGVIGPATVGDLAGGQDAVLAVDGLTADYDGYDLRAIEVDVRSVPAGLAGLIRYEIDGRDGVWVVTSDFGDGVLYPESTWSCSSGCAEPDDAPDPADRG